MVLRRRARGVGLEYGSSLLYVGKGKLVGGIILVNGRDIPFTYLRNDDKKGW